MTVRKVFVALSLIGLQCLSISRIGTRTAASAVSRSCSTPPAPRSRRTGRPVPSRSHLVGPTARQLRRVPRTAWRVRALRSSSASARASARVRADSSIAARRRVPRLALRALHVGGDLVADLRGGGFGLGDPPLGDRGALGASSSARPSRISASSRDWLRMMSASRWALASASAPSSSCAWRCSSAGIEPLAQPRPGRSDDVQGACAGFADDALGLERALPPAAARPRSAPRCAGPRGSAASRRSARRPRRVRARRGRGRRPVPWRRSCARSRAA